MRHGLVIVACILCAVIGGSPSLASDASPLPLGILGPSPGPSAGAVPDMVFGGPLAAEASRFTMTVPALPGDGPVTWGVAITNATEDPMTILEVIPQGVEGLEVVGIGAWVAAGTDLIGNAWGWPPAGVTLTPVDGLVVPPTEEPTDLNVLIGTRLAAGVSSGSIRSLRVRYQVGNTTYDDDLPWTFEVVPPASLVPGTSAVPAASMTSGQSRSPSISPGPSAPTAVGYPAPPPDFDPASIRWIGQIDDASEQAWVGAIDGSGLVALSTVSADSLLAADGSVVGLVRRKGDPSRYRLVREVPGGSSTTLISDASGALTLAEDGTAAYVARRGGDANHFIDRGYWRIPLDGSRPRRVLPPSDLLRTIGVVSPSGRSVATAYPSDIGGRRPQARFSMGRPRMVPGMFPLGFDERGRLIGMRERIVRYGPWTRTLAPVLGDPEASGDVLPGGVWLLLTFPDAEVPSPPALIDLGTGERTDLELLEGRWRQSPFSTDRYAVLEARPGGRLTYAVVDLEEHWIGYVAFDASWARIPAG